MTNLEAAFAGLLALDGLLTGWGLWRVHKKFTPPPRRVLRKEDIEKLRRER